MSNVDRRLTGVWHDGQGSEIVLEIGAGGALSGRFRPGGEPEREYALTGFTWGNQVAFVVAFERHGTLASWVGHLVEDAGGDELQTLWHMVLQPPHPAKKDERWRGTWAGSDVFRPGAAPKDRPRKPILPLWP